MPHDQEPDQPLWPSDDSDTSDKAEASTPGEGGRTAQLPVPDGQRTSQLPVPPRLPESPTVWVPHPAQPKRATPSPAPQDNQQERSRQGDLRDSLSPERQGSPQAASSPGGGQQDRAAPTAGQGGSAQDRARQGDLRDPRQPDRPQEWSPPARSPQPAPDRPVPDWQQDAPTQQWHQDPNQEWPQARPAQPYPARPPQQRSQPFQPPQQSQQPPQIPPASTVHVQPMRVEPNGEVHAAEQVSGDEPPSTPPAPPTPPGRRKRRGLVFGGLALVLVIALGVASALPYVSNRLGLPWAPNLPKGPAPQPAVVNLALKAPSPSAPTPTASGVAAALAGPATSPDLATLTGTVLDPATGTTLWDRNSGQPLTPASTTKLLTLSAALLTLDQGMQLTTKVVAGATPDTAILVAGGDPTLSGLPDGQSSIYPGAAHLDDLVAQVKRASGGTIKKVQIDLSLYSGPQTPPGWDPGDAPQYAAAIVPGMLDAGLTDPSNEESMRVANPAQNLLQAFAQRLGATAAGTTVAPKDAQVLGQVSSAPLTELIDNTLEMSDNTLAEMIGRQTAIATGAPPTFDGVAATTMKVLSQNGFDLTGVQVHDGSGLSSTNKVPARLLAQLLGVAAGPDGKDPRTAKLRPLLEGLPVAGGSGTLAVRYGAPNSVAGKGWVRAKTGTLNGVNTLAGVVLDSDNRVLVFALMSNGSAQDPGRAALDVMAAALRGCGCR
ncbi:MAG TPA: D-alanyl-D-alanine carboxypeptidase/D-alanyl-D-alanine-endopeptidase [Amycolatopsis sp.]|nr:D-alanyl-D-alanine carboxypeptidase/D-alanyl-D-alanine-endopeptidase [Amycolatopsis sp.]